jgi:putative membrane protein insertion efficiency factor
MKFLVVALIRLYQVMLAPFWGPCCRFTPSCSHYCLEGIEKKGLAQGLFLSVKRLLKRHPFHAGGYDPVP